MAIASEFPAHVAGQQTRIIETTMFMGRKQRVQATHLGFKDQSAGVMIYAVGMDRREFESLLAGITRTTTNAINAASVRSRKNTRARPPRCTRP